MGRSLLLLSAGFLVVLGIIKIGIQNRQASIPERSISYHNENNAQNVANSLMDYAISELDQNQNWSRGFSSNDFMGGKGSVKVYDYDDFLAGPDSLPDQYALSGWNRYTLLVVSKAEINGLEATSEAALQRDGLSKYTYFTNFEPSYIYFFDGDTLDGPVHTNGRFHIAGDPVFKGKVTSPNMWEGHSSYTNDPEFLGGADFGAQSISLPNNLSELQSAASTGGLSFNNDIYTIFRDNGTVDIYERHGWSWSSPTNYDLSSYNGVISSTRKVYTKGKVKGKVTLHSSEEVEIMGDLEYATNPLEDSDSQDVLGIISEGDVIIDDDAHQDNGSKDININATIMALGESFSVEDYYYGSPRGTINLVGGIQQQQRGAVGTFGSGGIRSGFSKNYQYDNRLQNSVVPPYYPRESFYSLKYWIDRKVKIASN
jgi:hypothetical protein